VGRSFQSAIRSLQSEIRNRPDAVNRRVAELAPSGQNWNRTDFYPNADGQVLEERYGGAQAKEDVPAAARCQYVWVAAARPAHGHYSVVTRCTREVA
jgi:hypothetical protein